MAIGKIEEVYAHTAKVKLFSTSSEETQAFLGRGNVAVTTIGKGGGNFEIDIPQGITVNRDDVILLPGIDSEMLAIVLDIETNPIDSFQKVLAKTPVNNDQIRFVTIEKN